MNPRKIILVGDSKVGKSILLARYRQTTPRIYHPTVYDIVSDNRFSIIDTDGDDSYKLLRPLSYTGALLVVILFALDDHKSFTRISTHWLPELRASFKGSCILLGTKNDLTHTVTREEIAALVTKQKLPCFTIGNLQHHSLDAPNREAERKVAEFFDVLDTLCPQWKQPSWFSRIRWF